MTFKKILVLILAVLPFSCTEFLKGKPKKEESITVSKESVDCVNGLKEKWKTLLDSTADEKEVDKAFDCIDATLGEFQNRVEGEADANSFTAEELQKIFTRFTPNAEISAEATKELLLLKAALLGGPADKITKQEISQLRKFVDLVKVEAKALLPYVQLLKFKKEITPFSKKMLQDGFGQLNVSLKNLFKSSQLYRSDYDLNDLLKLVMSLKILDEEQSQLLPLAGFLKNLLAGTQVLQAENDYIFFIDNLTDALKLYSYHVQGYVQFAIEKPSSLDDTIGYVENWLSLLESSLQFKKTKTISTETLDPLIAEISKRGLIPVSLQTETLLQFYKMLIVRAFDSGINGDVSAFTGLNQSHFVRIRREVAVFKMYAQMLAQFDVKERTPLAKVQEKVRDFRPDQLAWFKGYDEASKKIILTAFEEMRAEFLGSKPVVYRFNKMIVTMNQEIWDQNWSDLANGLYVKMLSRELMLGWGTLVEKSMNKSYLTEAQLVQWYSDFKQFGIEVKTFDPRSNNSGAVSFKQANLLTYSANGDDQMNFNETIQYLNMLLSGGGTITSEIQNGFAQAQCQLKEKDVFGNFWVDEKCAMADLRKNYKTYFQTLSTLNAYLTKISDEKFNEFFTRALDVTRVTPQTKGNRIETADLRNMIILLHYIESLYTVFDKDRNWNFSSAEIRAAYPRFLNFAKKYAYDHARSQIDEFNGILANTVGGYHCFSEEDLIRESFIFLVFHGRTPTKSDLSSFPCFLMKPLIDFKGGEVDRTRIINTFQILKTVLGS